VALAGSASEEGKHSKRKKRI